jgi:parvulin-like peptidyl-prolyl cis-trans isomerase-like protein
LVQAMIAQSLAQGGSADPSDDELKAYIAANAEMFRTRSKAKVDAVFVPDGDAGKRAAVETALGRGDWDGAKQAGAPPPVAIPDDFLIASKIADYAGADAASAVLRVPVGQATPLIATSGGAISLKLVAAEGDEAAPFATIRDTALARWREERDAKALRAAIDALRAQADIVMPQ